MNKILKCVTFIVFLSLMSNIPSISITPLSQILVIFLKSKQIQVCSKLKVKYNLMSKIICHLVIGETKN